MPGNHSFLRYFLAREGGGVSACKGTFTRKRTFQRLILGGAEKLGLSSTGCAGPPSPADHHGDCGFAGAGACRGRCWPGATKHIRLRRLPRPNNNRTAHIFQLSHLLLLRLQRLLPLLVSLQSLYFVYLFLV